MQSHRILSYSTWGTWGPDKIKIKLLLRMYRPGLVPSVALVGRANRIIYVYPSPGETEESQLPNTT